MPRHRLIPQGLVPATAKPEPQEEAFAKPEPQPPLQVAFAKPLARARPVDIRRQARLLSAEADVEIRTAVRALEEGAESIRAGRVRERVLLAAETLGFELPSSKGPSAA